MASIDRMRLADLCGAGVIVGTLAADGRNQSVARVLKKRPPRYQRSTADAHPPQVFTTKTHFGHLAQTIAATHTSLNGDRPWFFGPREGTGVFAIDLRKPLNSGRGGRVGRRVDGGISRLGGQLQKGSHRCVPRQAQ